MNQEFLLEPSFSRGPSQAWEPRPGNSGLWAAPGTLLALPGGPVRERLIFLPPAVQKILPITPDRFGCRAGGQRSMLRAAPPHPVQEWPLQTPAAAPHTSQDRRSPPPAAPPVLLSVVGSPGFARSWDLLQGSSAAGVPVLTSGHTAPPIYPAPGQASRV